MDLNPRPARQNESLASSCIGGQACPFYKFLPLKSPLKFLTIWGKPEIRDTHPKRLANCATTPAEEKLFHCCFSDLRTKFF